MKAEARLYAGTALAFAALVSIGLSIAVERGAPRRVAHVAPSLPDILALARANVQADRSIAICEDPAGCVAAHWHYGEPVLCMLLAPATNEVLLEWPPIVAPDGREMVQGICGRNL